ncbi:MAG TPA: SRPBCC domain-containing protein [Casimicrobiaceae bacterium]
MMVRLETWPGAAMALALAASTQAAVVQIAPSGFAVRHETTVNAPPAKVYDALVQVGSWWNPDHSFSGDVKNLSIDARAGGCFCERLKDGGAVEHLRVVYVAPGQALRMSGALGPLQASGLAGSLTWKLVPAASGTKMELTYSVGGFIDGGFDKMAPAVDGVLGEQLERLKRFVETGKPAAAN